MKNGEIKNEWINLGMSGCLETLVLDVGHILLVQTVTYNSISMEPVSSNLVTMHKSEFNLNITIESIGGNDE